MYPSNTQVTPEIKKVIDSNGDGHTVIPTPHEHEQSEVRGLGTALAAKADTSTVNAALNGKASVAQVNAKASKVSGAVSGHFAGLDSNGDLTDSGKKASDFMPATTIDSTPTANSTNLVTSGGVKTALDGKQNTLTFDTTPTANSTNPVTSGGVKTALDGKMNNKTIDSTPTANSTNLVTSGGVKTALDGKMNNKTIDQTPTDGNTTHLISSDAVYEALKDMAKWVTVKQVTLGQGGADTYSQYGILVGDYTGDFFVYQQIRLVPVGGSDTICEYGAVKTKATGPYYIISDIDVYSIASTHRTSTFDLQILQ